MSNRDIAERIFMTGIASVLPDKLIAESISRKGPVLRFGDLTLSAEKIRNLYVIGAGKASAAMGHYVESILGDLVTGGLIITKYGHACMLQRIKVKEAGHPVPDMAGFEATREIIEICDGAGEDDLVVCLLSGGGSALMSDLPSGLLPEDIYLINNLLVRCGADITEINTVRKHLSEIKGGQLVKRAWPASLVSIMISDVSGNKPDVIASGPTVPDTTTFHDAWKVLEKYHLTGDVTMGIKELLLSGVDGKRPETPKPGDSIFDRTSNLLAGTNETALIAAQGAAADSGYNALIVTDNLSGDSENAAQMIIETALSFKDNIEASKPLCLLYGGETTIKVTGNGLGGRNQHLALAAAIKLANYPGITILSAGTDGNDGPTDAAGAVVDSSTIKSAESVRIDPEKHLREFDSYSFFRKAGGHIITGPTYTNVMDLVIVLVD
ncbi:MAG: glycerate kinase [Bacteroidales bacterium]|jgi:hydroxypyruvate reductase/glycerate 2-kinase|nr:glycerate kinase [Bacteroidales bacterium]